MIPKGTANIGGWCWDLNLSRSVNRVVCNHGLTGACDAGNHKCARCAAMYMLITLTLIVNGD